VGESGLSVREIIDLPFNALVYRVKALEDKIVDQASQITALASTIAQNRTEMALKHADHTNMGKVTAYDCVKDLMPIMDVPKDLMPTPGKFRARKNRTSEVVAKRWALWKIQYEAGHSFSEIARAWGCDHSTINYAFRKNFNARKRKDQRISL